MPLLPPIPPADRPNRDEVVTYEVPLLVHLHGRFAGRWVTVDPAGDGPAYLLGLVVGAAVLRVAPPAFGRVAALEVVPAAHPPWPAGEGVVGAATVVVAATRCRPLSGVRPAPCEPDVVPLAEAGYWRAARVRWAAEVAARMTAPGAAVPAAR